MAISNPSDGNSSLQLRQSAAPLAKLMLFLRLVLVLLRWSPPSALTPRAIARRVGFPHRARQDAINATRSGLGVDRSPTEAHAANLLATSIGRIEDWRAYRLRYRRACLEQLNIPIPQQAFAGTLADGARKVASARQSFRARIKPLERDARKSEHRADDCEAVFKPQAGPRYAHPLVPIASISLGALVDASFAAPFFQKVLPYGYFGGVFVAFLFTVPLILLAFVAFGLIAPMFGTRSKS